MTTTDRGSADTVDLLYDELYERHGKPLEARHAGEFLAVSPDGRTVLGPTLIEAARTAVEQLGPGVCLYKIGERSVGRWH